MNKPCKHCGVKVLGCKDNNYKVVCEDCKKQKKRDYLRKWQKENPSKTKAYCKKYRDSHPETVKAQIEANRKVLSVNPERKMLYAAKTRAKKKNIECTITKSDIVIPKICPILGIPIIPDGRLNANSPSLDRFDPAVGYTPKNISVVSFRANTLKSDASLEEVRKLLIYLERETDVSNPCD